MDATEFMQEQTISNSVYHMAQEMHSRAHDCNCKRRANATSSRAGAPNSAPPSKETRMVPDGRSVQNFRSPMPRPKETTFFFFDDADSTVSSKESSGTGIGKDHGWEENEDQSRTVSLHRLAPRRAGQEDDAEEEGQGGGERRGSHGRTVEEERRY